MITRRDLTLTLGALSFGLSATGAATAQSYPTKPIRFIVPFPAGGSTHVGARVLAEYLSRSFGQQVYVENKWAPMEPSVSRRWPRACRMATPSWLLSTR